MFDILSLSRFVRRMTDDTYTLRTYIILFFLFIFFEQSDTGKTT